MKKKKKKKERHTPQPLHWGNVNGHLPGIARLVSGIVCILCGKLAIQSANRMSLLPWDEAMLSPCTTLRSPGPVPAQTWSRALSLSLHTQRHTPTLSLSLSLTHTHTSLSVKINFSLLYYWNRFFLYSSLIIFLPPAFLSSSHLNFSKASFQYAASRMEENRFIYSSRFSSEMATVRWTHVVQIIMLLLKVIFI